MEQIRLDELTARQLNISVKQAAALIMEGRIWIGDISADKAGTAVAEDRTQLVADVHQFPGHIACDGASNSEIVVPIHKDGQVWGVLDIDSPLFDRFAPEDREGLEDFVKALETALFGA